MRACTFARTRRVYINVSRGLALSWGASSGSLIRCACLVGANATVAPISLYLSAVLVNRVVDASRSQIWWTHVLVIVAALWVVSSLQRSASVYMAYGRDLFVRRIQFEAERQLLARVSEMNIGHLDGSDWRDRLARAKRDIAWRPGDLTWSMLMLAGHVVTVILMAGLLATLHYALMGLAFASALASLICERRITVRLYGLFYTDTPEERERDYLGSLLMQPHSLREVVTYGLAGVLLTRHTALSASLLRRREDVYRSALGMSIVAGLAAGSGLALSYVFLATQSSRGAIAPGDIVLVIGACLSLSSTLNHFSTACVAIEQHAAFLDDYFRCTATDESPPPNACVGTSAVERIRRIEFDRVTFAYPGQTVAVLRGVSLDIQENEFIAIVGENGAGKSTLVKLLLRHYDASDGVLRINGTDVRRIDPDALRRRIGVLFQDFIRYELSLRDNVGFGRSTHEGNDPSIIKALKHARCERMLQRMPDGLDANVGLLRAGGHELSGGEWQRLALARAMYRDADIWVLDEPTASLDPEAEAAVVSSIKKQLNGRIGVMISHRLSAARSADRIVVMEGGCIVETGSHDDLVRSAGPYAELFETQASMYR